MFFMFALHAFTHAEDREQKEFYQPQFEYPHDPTSAGLVTPFVEYEAPEQEEQKPEREPSSEGKPQ